MNMKTYCYDAWDYMGNERIVELTEQEILKRYWKYWKGKMIEKHGEDSFLITKEECIKDWCVVNYAWEKE